MITMKKGEVALFTISPEYAFGSSVSQQELAKVPPNSTVLYEVELVSFDKVSLTMLLSSSIYVFVSLRFQCLELAYVYCRKGNLGI